MSSFFTAAAAAADVTISFAVSNGTQIACLSLHNGSFWIAVTADAVAVAVVADTFTNITTAVGSYIVKGWRLLLDLQSNNTSIQKFMRIENISDESLQIFLHNNCARI